MPRKSNNQFRIHGDTISITREGWDQIAYATYREDYYEELSTHTWGIVNGYPSNRTLGGGLHRYMMAKWYGEDALSTFTAQGYVVDHMNNNHMDCRICNLEFLKHARNAAKGMWLDREAEQLRSRIALSVFKDFSTGCYQITIGCNAHIISTDSNGLVHDISKIKLLYNCDYPLVVLDAEAILAEYESSARFSLSHLKHCDCRIEEVPKIELTEEEKTHQIVERDGNYYLVLREGHTMIHTVAYDKCWEPPKS